MSTGEVRHAIVSAERGERIRAVPMKALRMARDGTLALGADVYHEASRQRSSRKRRKRGGGQKLGELTDLIVDMDGERVSYGVADDGPGDIGPHQR